MKVDFIVTRKGAFLSPKRWIFGSHFLSTQDDFLVARLLPEGGFLVYQKVDVLATQTCHCVYPPTHTDVSVVLFRSSKNFCSCFSDKCIYRTIKASVDFIHGSFVDLP